MELKTKYQYTYFVYPFVVKKGEYSNLIGRIVLDENWGTKLFSAAEEPEIDSHFLLSAKKKLFPSIKWTAEERKKFNSFNIKKKMKTISEMPSFVFEYNIGIFLTKGKIEEETAIFFDISKIKLICFKEGICFLLMKAEIDCKDFAKFSDVLNLNYKLRNVSPKFSGLEDYSHIKIQANKFGTAQDIKSFINQICNGYESEEVEDTFTNRLFVYSYVCLDESEWNNKREFDEIREEFLKFQYVCSGDYSSEFSRREDFTNTYSRWRYSIYGFSKMAGVVFSSAIDHFNFTKLPSYYENVYMYIFIYAFYERILLMMTTKDIIEDTKKANLRDRLIDIINMNSLGQIVNTEHGMNLWNKWRETFELKEMYRTFIEQYKLLNKI